MIFGANILCDCTNIICRLGGEMKEDELHYNLHVKIPGHKKGSVADVDLTSNISENEYFK